MTESRFTVPRVRTRREIGWAFLLALGVQTAGAFLWAGAASNRLSELEKRSDAIEVLLERTARLEEQGTGMRASLDRIERKVERLSTDEKAK